MMAAQGGDDDPILYTIAVNDVATASVVAASVVAALNARDRTGEGQEVVSSLLAQSLLFQLDRMVDYPGRPFNPKGGRDCLGISALTRYYACADGWLWPVRRIRRLWALGARWVSRWAQRRFLNRATALWPRRWKPHWPGGRGT
jgi:crotonobetainyl-CoA:carnitine CoA-transferase CaiB-like acyl-CoA transferase